MFGFGSGGQIGGSTSPAGAGGGSMLSMTGSLNSRPMHSSISPRQFGGGGVNTNPLTTMSSINKVRPTSVAGTASVGGSMHGPSAGGAMGPLRTPGFLK